MRVKAGPHDFPVSGKDGGQLVARVPRSGPCASCDQLDIVSTLISLLLLVLLLLVEC